MEEDREEVMIFKDLGACEKMVEACEYLGWKNPVAEPGFDLRGGKIYN